MDGAPVFAMDLGCGNCGNEWIVEIAPLTAVQGIYPGGVWIHPDNCRNSGTLCTGHHVLCPVCDRANDVRVKTRRPLAKAGD